jgi:hypothetical protein
MTSERGLGKREKRRAPRAAAPSRSQLPRDDEGSEARVGWLASGNNEAPDPDLLLRARPVLPSPRLVIVCLTS